MLLIWKESIDGIVLIKMFNEKPIYGFGPGTYQFEYSSFQDPDDKTIISTKFGDGGNA